MAVNRWNLIFYTTAAGRSPVAEYLDELPAREAARVTQELRLLAEFGLGLGEPHVRNVGDKLWELRVRGKVQHRVLYFAAAEQRLVLLHAFTKKTRRTPSGELELARRRMADYLERT